MTSSSSVLTPIASYVCEFDSANTDNHFDYSEDYLTMFETVDCLNNKDNFHDERVVINKGNISDNNTSGYSDTNSTNPSPIPDYNNMMPNFNDTSMLLPISPEKDSYNYPIMINPQHLMEKQPPQISIQMQPPKTIQPQPPQKKRSRTAYTSYQLVALERAFIKNNYISRPARTFMAKELGLIEKQIKIWFQNRRMKENKSNNCKPKPTTIKERKANMVTVSREKQQQSLEKEYDHCIVTRLLSQRQQHFNQFASATSSYNVVAPRTLPAHPTIPEPPQYQMSDHPMHVVDNNSESVKRISGHEEFDYSSDYSHQFFANNYYEPSGISYESNGYYYDVSNYSNLTSVQETTSSPAKEEDYADFSINRQFHHAQPHTISWQPTNTIMEVPKMISL